MVIWFGLVSLFNDMSTFVGYIMLLLSLWKNSSDTIIPIAGGIREFSTLSQGHWSESERNRATGVRTRLLRCHNSVR